PDRGQRTGAARRQPRDRGARSGLKAEADRGARGRARADRGRPRTGERRLVRDERARRALVSSPRTRREPAVDGSDEFEAETYFPMLGMSIQVLPPGEPNSVYHWETEQEDFLVLAGEGILIVEGQERPVRQWDFVHCPPETRHAFVGAGNGPCVILAASSRQFQKDGPWGFYCADETAARYNASSPEDTQDGAVAYGRFPPSQPTRYRHGLLPG